MTSAACNKYRVAVQVLQRGRDQLVEALAEEIIDQADDLVEGSYIFNELIECQGTKLHFLSLLMSQLEQSAEQLDEAQAPPPPQPAPAKPRKPRAPRTKKLQEKASGGGSSGEV